MTGTQAEELIHQRAWIGQEPGLSRITELLSRLGDPQKKLKFIHIAGTNGKGSTALMIASILMQAGLCTGLYTSPHLWRFHERFQVNGTFISDEMLGEITRRVLAASETMEDQPTEFELITAVGMIYFLQSGCDIVVLETGLGGRLDSTNVIPVPEVAVITNIGLEHTEQLGNTLEAIAREKAGIIKPGGQVVLYHQSQEVENAVAEVCQRTGSQWNLTASDALKICASGRDGQSFIYREQGPFYISLLGRHQIQNAASALETVWVLRRNGWNIPEEAVMQGLKQAVWPARMELVRREPDVLLDGGHNPQCMMAIRQTLEELYPGKKVLFLTGVLGDKDYPAMLSHIIPLAKGFVTITPDSPRALPACELADYLHRAGLDADPCETLEEGVQRVLSLAKSEDVICICGSLYMAGEARHIMGLC